MKVAVIIPTIRQESYIKFLKAWAPLLDRHNAELVTVFDGKFPIVCNNGVKRTPADVLEKDQDLLYNYNDGVRNLGFAYCVKFLPKCDVLITLDDDVTPLGDSIEDHLKALSLRVPVSWISTATRYMRGFPYGIRNEAEVVLSHGVWEGIKDYDAATQLVLGNPDVQFYKGAIPKGIYYPMCIMNVAIKKKVLPFFYQAPMGPDVQMDRFADIWCGISSKRAIDKKGWAVVTGYSKVQHIRASNVFTNLQKEAKGLEHNETFWKKDPTDPYFKLYETKRKQWEQWINNYL